MVGCLENGDMCDSVMWNALNLWTANILSVFYMNGEWNKIYTFINVL